MTKAQHVQAPSGKLRSSGRGAGKLRRIGLPAVLCGLLLLPLTGCSTVPTNPGGSAANPLAAQRAHPPAPAKVSPPPLPTGSLWQPHNGSMYQDIKASNIGDIVTITVDEQSKGSRSASTSTSREHDLQGSLQFNGVTAGNNSTPMGAFNFGPYKSQFKNSSTGSGSTSSADSMTAYMTATVVNKLPNGNLVIRGSRWTKVNNDMQQIILEGVIRPTDITRNNTVLSQNIAQAKIFLVGKGPVANAQKPGWLGQLLNLILPF